MLKKESRYFLIALIIFTFSGAYPSSANIEISNDIKILFFTNKHKNDKRNQYLKYVQRTLGVEIIIIDEKLPDRISKNLAQISSVIISSEYFEKNPEYTSNLLTIFDNNIPFLFTDIRSSSQTILNQISIPLNITKTEVEKSGYIVISKNPVNSFLGGAKIKGKFNQSILLDLPDSQMIIRHMDSNNKGVFLKSKMTDNRKLYLLSQLKGYSFEDELDDYLFNLIPYFIFINDATEGNTWKGNDLFANFTIDDPFLIEPYGSLHYKKLLHEMQIHNFHTTIAFIPRNYARNEDEVINLFKKNPERFSISIHGNNHDRREFYRYKKHKIFEPFKVKSIEEQEFNIAQSIVRMNEFTRMTGIKYDKVMSFPQDISPAPTLGILKKYGYQATINGSNIPLDSDVTDKIKYNLRPVITNYYGFASFSRLKVKFYNSLRIRFAMFIGNPILLYSHHDIFKEDNKQFNFISDEINKISPKIKWRSLGEILSNWYLIRKNAENNYDVKIFTPEIIITNNNDTEKEYNVYKGYESENNVKTILVNNKSVNWNNNGETLLFKMKIMPNDYAKVEIKYDYKDRLVGIEPEDNDSLRIAFWRGISEFRDLHLEDNATGKLISDFIYDASLNKIFMLLIYCVIIVVTISLACLVWRKIKKLELLKG